MSTDPRSSEAEPSSQFFETRLWTHWDRRHEATPRDPSWLDRLLDRILMPLLLNNPLRVNKAYDPHFDSLDKWWVEFPADGFGQVWREIGFNEGGRPVLAGPSRRNYGYWNDTDLTLADFEHRDPTLTEVSADAFEDAWQDYMKSSGDGPEAD